MKVLTWASALALLVATAASGATVTTVATGLVGGHGSAFNPATQELFFTEYLSDKLSRFDVATGTVTTIHTGLGEPLAVDILYVSGTYYPYVATRDGRVFKCAPHSSTHTEVTNGLSTPRQMVIDSANAVAYISDSGTTGIWKVNLYGGQKTLIPTGLTSLIGLAMSADFQTAYLTDSSRLLKFDLKTQTLTTLVSRLRSPAGLAWANDAKTALYVVEGDSTTSRVRRIDLATTPAGNTLVADVPSPASSVVRALDPDILYEVSDGSVNQIRLSGGLPLGPVITRVGHIPSTTIDAATGLATTDPAYYFYVKNASFGGSPHIMLNFPGIRGVGGAYYRVFVDGSATPSKAIWNNYKWNGSTFVLTQVAPDANGYFAVPTASEIWAVPDLGFILNTQPLLSNAKHTVTVKTYTSAYALLATQRQVSLLIDNTGPTMEINQITHDGLPLDECGLVTSGSANLGFTFVAFDPQGRLFNYALVDRWGHGKSALITSDQYLNVHDSSTTWAGVNPTSVNYTLSCTSCSHTFTLSGYSNTTDGFGMVQFSSDSESVAIYLPLGTCSL
ncbi:hypothetical protein [Hyalangium versicolor]|uniref:hypothetical protein n=1 Tax=Hyalangium versicolor TaxID=2861190 RepID=UPI001CCAB50F|nr:hypothetical protein [Hyalangium versicolor]